jgi:hypothetical protein
MTDPTAAHQQPRRSQKFYTVLEAAKRIDRSRATIERYIAGGMPVTRVSRVRYIEEAALLEAFREALQANPTRRRRAE